MRIPGSDRLPPDQSSISQLPTAKATNMANPGRPIDNVVSVTVPFNEAFL